MDTQCSSPGHREFQKTFTFCSKFFSSGGLTVTIGLDSGAGRNSIPGHGCPAKISYNLGIGLLQLRKLGLPARSEMSSHMCQQDSYMRMIERTGSGTLETRDT